MGLLLWTVAGLGMMALSLLVGPRGWFRSRWQTLLPLALTGAIAGGMLATVFGFGGFLALDLRAAISAALGALGAILCSAIANSIR